MTRARSRRSRATRQPPAPRGRPVLAPPLGRAPARGARRRSEACRRATRPPSPHRAWSSARRTWLAGNRPRPARIAQIKQAPLDGRRRPALLACLQVGRPAGAVAVAVVGVDHDLVDVLARPGERVLDLLPAQGRLAGYPKARQPGLVARSGLQDADLGARGSGWRPVAHRVLPTARPRGLLRAYWPAGRRPRRADRAPPPAWRGLWYLTA